MTRYASSTNQAEGEKTSIGAFVAVALDFTSGFVQAHEALGTYTWGGNDIVGVGKLGGIEVVEESIDLVARSVTLVLSGVDVALVNSALDASEYQGRTATIYLAFVNLDTNALIDTPETAWEGRMNNMTITLGTEASIKLQCEHRMRREPRVARNTDVDEQLSYSGDLFFNMVGKIPGFKGMWGAKGVENNGGTIVLHPGWRTPYKP